MSLAVVINTCDKYSFIWDKWYYYFKKNWQYNYPVYFLNEKKDIDFPVEQIRVNIPEVELWTKKLRESIEQIPENNIFLLLEDHFIIKKFKKNEFERIYNAFEIINADALRIKDIARFYTIHDTEFFVNGINLKKFDTYSEYLISHSPNIWKKSFLLECIKYDESPWDSEIKDSERISDKKWNIYIYEKLDWYVNVLRQGKATSEGQKLINKINE